jgi:hypothetical protein
VQLKEIDEIKVKMYENKSAIMRSQKKTKGQNTDFMTQNCMRIEVKVVIKQEYTIRK